MRCCRNRDRLKFRGARSFGPVTKDYLRRRYSRTESSDDHGFSMPARDQRISPIFAQQVSPGCNSSFDQLLQPHLQQV